VPLVPVGHPVRPLVHGATPPSAADVPRRAAELIAAQFDKLAAAAEGCAGGGRHDADRRVAMTEHAVMIAGGGPTGLMLAGVDVAIVERRPSQDLPGSRRRSALTHHRGPRSARNR
jgi:hypothetical protein